MSVINIEDFKSITQLIRERLGDKFILAYIEDEGVNTYISSGLSDMEICYVADSINKNRRGKND